MTNSSESKFFFQLPNVKFNDLNKELKLVNANETNVVICKYENKVYGIQATCPHSGGPLHLGDIETLPDKSVCVKCPWHGWKFDIRTGEIKFPNVKDLSPITTYPIKIDNNKIFIGFDEINMKYFNSTDI